METDWPNDCVVRSSPEQISRDLEGETILLHLGSGTYFGLEGVGTFVWNLLQQPITVASLIDQVTSEFDVDSTSCAQDLRNLLRELSQHGLIERRDKPA